MSNLQFPYKHLLSSLSPEKASLVSVVWSQRIEFYRCLSIINAADHYEVKEKPHPKPMSD